MSVSGVAIALGLVVFAALFISWVCSSLCSAYRPGFLISVGPARARIKKRSSQMLEITLTVSQEVDFTAVPVDPYGVAVPVDGPVQFTSLSPSIVEVIQGDDDSCILRTTGITGPAQVRAMVDVRLGPDVVTIQEMVTVNVVAEEATTFQASLGTPRVRPNWMAPPQ